MKNGNNAYLNREANFVRLFYNFSKILIFLDISKESTVQTNEVKTSLQNCISKFHYYIFTSDHC
jgi:hypothetical protein